MLELRLIKNRRICMIFQATFENWEKIWNKLIFSYTYKSLAPSKGVQQAFIIG